MEVENKRYKEAMVTYQDRFNEMENREWELIDQNEELYRSNVTLEVELRSKE